MPARKTTIANPRLRQTAIAMIEGIASTGSASQAGP